LNRVCSIFSQILQLCSRLEFESAVRHHKAARHARGFSCWGQFVSMLFCQLGHAQSLREICGGLGVDCHVADQVSAIAGPLRLVIVEPGGSLAAAAVCVPRSVDLD